MKLSYFCILKTADMTKEDVNNAIKEGEYIAKEIIASSSDMMSVAQSIKNEGHIMTDDEIKSLKSECASYMMKLNDEQFVLEHKDEATEISERFEELQKKLCSHIKWLTIYTKVQDAANEELCIEVNQNEATITWLTWKYWFEMIKRIFRIFFLPWE